MNEAEYRKVIDKNATKKDTQVLKWMMLPWRRSSLPQHAYLVASCLNIIDNFASVEQADTEAVIYKLMLNSHTPKLCLSMLRWQEFTGSMMVQHAAIECLLSLLCT